MEDPGLRVGPRHYRDAAEYRRSREIRIHGFTEWYVGPPRTPRDAFARLAANTRARLFPDHLLEVRTSEGRLVACLTAVPGYWSGAPEALHDLHYYDRTLDYSTPKSVLVNGLFLLTVELLGMGRLFDRALARQRQRKTDGANAIILIGMAVDPEYRGRRIPSLLLTEVQRTAARLGLEHVVAPFRPNAYGKYKAARRAAHDPALFEEYCHQKDEEGWPQDPWLRVVARHGARFLRPEPRSFTVGGTLAAFEAFRDRHKSQCWYSPSPDVWECGETPTWYVDRCRKLVLSVEPNLWGVLPVAR